LDKHHCFYGKDIWKRIISFLWFRYLESFVKGFTHKAFSPHLIIDQDNCWMFHLSGMSEVWSKALEILGNISYLDGDIYIYIFKTPRKLSDQNCLHISPDCDAYDIWHAIPWHMIPLHTILRFDICWWILHCTLTMSSIVFEDSGTIKLGTYYTIWHGLILSTYLVCLSCSCPVMPPVLLHKLSQESQITLSLSSWNLKLIADKQHVDKLSIKSINL